MSPPLLLAHGWGLDAGFWRPLSRRLPDFRASVVNIGFRGARAVPAPERPLVVGHSMGFAWALANIPGPWAGAVAVNAFPRFTRSPDFVEGVAPRMIERMIARFAREPATVTAEFLGRCGIAQPDLAGLDYEALALGLSWLAACDERPAFARLDCPVLALGGTRDPIVPEVMSRAAFAGRSLELLAGGGHLLPETHPEWVASRIRLLAASAA